MRKSTLGLLLVLLAATTNLFAATRLVTTSGTDAGDCTVAPCATLNYAIGQAVNGDTISVGAGTFNNGGANVNVNKTLIVVGAQAGVDARTRVATETIITVPVLLSADSIVFDGFTVNCGACGGIGAGIASSSSFSGYQIVNNIVTGNPIGIFYGSSGVIQSVVRFNNIFDNNNGVGVLAAAGTGIYSDTGVTNALIDQNRFSGNLTAQINIIGPGAPATVQITNNNFALDAVDDGAAVVLFRNTGTTVTGNTITGAAGSGIFLGGADINITISNNTITNGLSSAISISDAGFGPNGLITITSNTILNNLRGISAGAGNPVPIEAHFNRIVGNTTAMRTTAAGVTINGENNWFGCNAGPATCAVITIAAGSTIDVDPWLVMDIVAVPNVITTLQTSNVTTDFNQNSNGTPVAGFPDGTVITFGATGGNVAPPTAPTSGGAASTTFTPAGAGAATASATLDSQTVTANITVGAVATSTALMSSQNPSTVGQSVMFTATVTPNLATGTVQFFDGATPLGGPVTLVGGTAQLTTNTLTAGSHTITAVYSGDATYAGSTSPPLTQVVNAVADVGVTGSVTGPFFATLAATKNFTVTNNGPDAAPNVTLNDPMPAGLTANSATPSQGSCSIVANVVNCNLGTINSGSSVTVAISVTPTAAQQYSNTATVGTTGIDNNAANNSSTQTFTAQPAGAIPAISPLLLALLGAMLGAIALVMMRR